MKKQPLLAEVIAGLLILLFAYTAFSKIIEHRKFQFALRESPLIQYRAGAVSWLIPIIELMVALLLFFPATRRRGLYASFILLNLFTGYLLYMLSFSKDLPCTCGGVISEMSWTQHIFFNLFFIAISLAGIIILNKNAKHIT